MSAASRREPGSFEPFGIRVSAGHLAPVRIAPVRIAPVRSAAPRFARVRFAWPSLVTTRRSPRSRRHRPCRLPGLVAAFYGDPAAAKTVHLALHRANPSGADRRPPGRVAGSPCHGWSWWAPQGSVRADCWAHRRCQPLRVAEFARRMVTLRSGRCGGSWNGSWNGSQDDPSVVSAVSAMIRVIGAARGSVA